MKTRYGVLVGVVFAWMSGTTAIAGVELVRSDWNATELRFTLDGYNAQRMKAQGHELTRVEAVGMNPSNRRGEPALPSQTVSIQLPASSLEPELTIVTETSHWENLGVIAPGRGSILRNADPVSVPFVFGPLYQATRFVPQLPAGLSRPYVMRDVLGVTVTFSPFQYDPTTGMTRVTREAVVRISTPHAASARASERALFVGSGSRASTKLPQDFAALYESRFINFSALKQQRGVSQPIIDTAKLLVIAHPDFVQALGPLVTWKNQKGIQTRLMTLDDAGGNAAGIARSIAQAYRDEKISSVILVGDAEFMPYFPGVFGNAYQNEADPLYGAIQGKGDYNDEYPEVIVSRFPVKTVQDTQTMVAKVLSYERDAQAGEWYSRAIGVASNESGGPDELIDWERANILASMLGPWGYTQIDRVYDPSASLDQLISNLNEGRGLVNYLGHGSETEWVTTGLNTQEIRKLENVGKLPFIVDVACVNGRFAYPEESFAEAWVLAGTAEAPKGAIGIFASSTNQAWYEPTIGQKAITEFLTQNVYNTLGTLFMHGSVAVLDADLVDSNQTFETWHIFGDATLQVRTRSPEQLPVRDMPEALTPSRGEIKLDLGKGGVVAALSQRGKLIGRGISNDQGLVRFQYDGSALEVGKPAQLTLTGFNLRSRIQDIPVTQ